MLFGMLSRLDPRNHILYGGSNPPWEWANFERERACPESRHLRQHSRWGKHFRACPTTLCRELHKNGGTARDAVWVLDSVGPKEACVIWECILVQAGEYTTEPSMFGEPNEAAAMRPYVKLLWPLVQLHANSTASAFLRSVFSANLPKFVVVFRHKSTESALPSSAIHSYVMVKFCRYS